MSWWLQEFKGSKGGSYLCNLDVFGSVALEIFLDTRLGIW